MSCTPASVIDEVTRMARVATSRPSSSIRVMPPAAIAAWFERAINVTGSPEWASLTPRKPPIAPVPTMAMLMILPVFLVWRMKPLECISATRNADI